MIDKFKYVSPLQKKILKTANGNQFLRTTELTHLTPKYSSRDIDEACNDLVYKHLAIYYVMDDDGGHRTLKLSHDGRYFYHFKFKEFWYFAVRSFFLPILVAFITSFIYNYVSHIF